MVLAEDNEGQVGLYVEVMFVFNGSAYVEVMFGFNGSAVF